MSKFQPLLEKPWDHLENHYREATLYAPQFAGIMEAMADLCRGINECHLNSSLFGHTSHHTLQIAQTSTVYPPHPSIQFLVIEPQLELSLVEFRFEDTQRRKDQWQRQEQARGVIDRFNGFLVQVGWSTEGIPRPIR
ncbi:MAG: hypothetical protein ABNH53_12725 [Henriciella sp.]|jgi:hypothetical protein